MSRVLVSSTMGGTMVGSNFSVSGSRPRFMRVVLLSRGNWFSSGEWVRALTGWGKVIANAATSFLWNRHCFIATQALMRWNFIEKRMAEGFEETQTLVRIILQHFGNEVKELTCTLVICLHVALKRTKSKKWRLVFDLRSKCSTKKYW